jgi:hypothetical protein
MTPAARRRRGSITRRRRPRWSTRVRGYFAPVPLLEPELDEAAPLSVGGVVVELGLDGVVVELEPEVEPPTVPEPDVEPVVPPGVVVVGGDADGVLGLTGLSLVRLVPDSVQAVTMLRPSARAQKPVTILFTDVLLVGLSRDPRTKMQPTCHALDSVWKFHYYCVVAVADAPWSFRPEEDRQ